MTATMSAADRHTDRQRIRNTSNLCLRKLHEQCVADRCLCPCHHRAPDPPAPVHHEEADVAATAESLTPPPPQSTMTTRRRASSAKTAARASDRVTPRARTAAAPTLQAPSRPLP